MDLGTGGGKKKSLDAALNLVPFIDLMAVTIVFLIMSAVWTQLGRLNVSQGGHHQGEATPPQVPIALSLSEKKLSVQVGGAVIATFETTRDAHGRLRLDEVVRKLDEVKARFPDQPAITVRAEDALSYDDLVRVIDACVGTQFPAVSVEPIAEGA